MTYVTLALPPDQVFSLEGEEGEGQDYDNAFIRSLLPMHSFND